MAKRRKRMKKEKNSEQVDDWGDSDETFAFIVGYTSGGAPYGVKWEDLDEEEMDLFRSEHTNTKKGDDSDFPF